jgi:putative endonuclease
MADLPAGRQALTKNMFYVYALSSTTRRYIYVGLTNSPQRRINQHQSGYEKTTSPYRPFVVLLIEEFPTRPEARVREKHLKSGTGKEFLKRVSI